MSDHVIPGSGSEPTLSERLELDFSRLLAKFVFITWNVVGAEEKFRVIDGLVGRPYCQMKQVVKSTSLFVRDVKGTNSRSQEWTNDLGKIVDKFLVGFEYLSHFVFKEESGSRDWSYIEKCVTAIEELTNELAKPVDEELMQKWLRVGQWYAMYS